MSLDEYTITRVSADDWHWYFVGMKLVYEGHSWCDQEIIKGLFEGLVGPGDPCRYYQFEVSDSEASERCHNTFHPTDFSMIDREAYKD